MNSPLILSLRKQKNYCGSRIKILSPAKINLYLNILGKYSDGYHQIESIIERVSLFDEIAIEVKEEDRIKVFCKGAIIPSDRNLCLKAAKLLKDKFCLPFGFDIYLNKHIPVGAGLGGGSSNAAFTLLGIDTLLDLHLSKEKFYSMGRKLGSDVNFFLSRDKFAYVGGKGENIKPLLGKKIFHFVIWPQISLSTKKVYSQARVGLTKYFNNVKIMCYALKRRDLFLLRKSIFNALEESVFKVCKELKNIKRYLEKQGLRCWLTGSGSALYTIMDKKLLSRYRGFFSKSWQVFVVQTL
jgi:4-diphosphocytidyl-2-C-methyl-D-erythritol kinase